MARENGRFTLMEKPRAFPFTDLVNNTPDGPVFDLGIVLEMRDGVGYIKAEHIAEMAEQLGYASPVEVAELKQQVEELTKEVEVLPQRIGKFNAELNGLVARYHDDLRTGGDSVSVPLSEGYADEESKEPESSATSTFDPFGQVFGTDILEGSNDLSASTSSKRDSSKAGAKG